MWWLPIRRPQGRYYPYELLGRWVFSASEAIGHDDIAPANGADCRVREWLDQTVDPVGSRYSIVVCEGDQWSLTGREPSGHRRHLAPLFD